MADPVIDALSAAVAAQPEVLELRTHLAELLLAAAAPGVAKGHLQVALRLAPDDLQTLKLSAACWAQLGDDVTAARYQRLADALSGSPAAPSPGSEGSLAKVASEGERDSIDAELEELISEYRRSDVRLSDVAGLQEVKRRLDLTFFAPLRNPEFRSVFGTSLHGGLLLYGPPGCGKRLLAKALAGELSSRFIAVELHQVLDMWLGNSEKNLHALFDEARRLAPCVVFFDELDAIGMARTANHVSGVRNVLAQLLIELDGAIGNNDGVYILGATNQPWDVDPALKRPGRFSRSVFVPPPDEPARRAILARGFTGRPTDDLDFSAAARRTNGFSGADLRHACDRASELALEASVRAGHVVPVTNKMLNSVLASLRASTAPWLESARNVVNFANRSGEYDELSAFLRSR